MWKGHTLLCIPRCSRSLKLLSYYKPSQEWELFDLEKDPNELQSVYADPAYRKVRERLQGELAELRAEYDVPKNVDE